MGTRQYNSIHPKPGVVVDNCFARIWLIIRYMGGTKKWEKLCREPIGDVVRASGEKAGDMCNLTKSPQGQIPFFSRAEMGCPVRRRCEVRRVTI